MSSLRDFEQLPQRGPWADAQWLHHFVPLGLRAGRNAAAGRNAVAGRNARAGSKVANTAANRRQVVAMGASQWNWVAPRRPSPEGTT